MNDIPKYVINFKGKLYCYLYGELDKDDYTIQCEKCALNSKCIKRKPIYKRVPEDWHSFNAKGLYGDLFVNADKALRKELRSISKVVGLALTYGASPGVILRHMPGESLDSCKVKINNFFNPLHVLRDYMKQVVSDAFATKMSYTKFNRKRSLAHLLDFSKFKNMPVQKRRREEFLRENTLKNTALNNPIQGTCAEVYKIGMIRVSDYFKDNNLSPLAQQGIPQHIDLKNVSYKNVKFAQINSVHDEFVFMAHQSCIEDVVPNIGVVLQLEDLAKLFNVGFVFDTECEFDDYRSWTASKKYQDGLAYLLNVLNDRIPHIEPEDVNYLDTIVIKSEFMTKESAIAINNNLDNTGIYLAVVSNDKIFFHERKFTREFIEMLGIPYEIKKIK